tara:strand:- start:590 stop:2575 length:1986 start_codon:yes stop_codon:yes gene_type:complete
MAIPNYYSYKKIYTSGDMFTLTGSDFYGFAETADGVVKEPSTGKTLVPKSTYRTDLLYTEYFKDRVVSDIDLTLPNTRDKCLFNLNDNFNYDLFKYKLEKLRDNNTFVYSKLFIPSNKLPFASTLRYATVSSVNTQEFTINISDNNNPDYISNKKFAQNYYLSAFGNIVAATAQTNVKSLSTNNPFALFAATTTNLICLTGDDDKLTIVEDSTGYESKENDLAFNEIGGLASTKDFLYLADTGNNVVLKYDIAGYVNNDSSLRNRRNYIELIGGFGGETRQTKFDRPTKLAASSTELAVFDSGNRVIKLFDNELNFITRITSINFNKETFGAMNFDPDFGSLYVVTFRDITTDDITVRTTFLYRFSGEGYRFKEEFIMNDTLAIEDNEEVNSLSFSGTDSNYWYFGTNKTIYKKFKTRPVEIIGKFRTQRLYLLNYADTTQKVVNTESIATINNRWNFNDISFSTAKFNWNLGTIVGGLQETTEVNGLLDDNITSFSIFPGTSSFDRAIMLTTGRLFFFDEPTSSAYQRVLKDFNYNNYGSAGFSLNPDSFIQQSIVNTELYKVLNDTLNIKNNIVGRFTGKFKNDILELDDYNYEIDFKQLLTQSIENLYIHSNEENLTGVLNRCFNLIYDLQQKLINIVQVNVEATVQPSFTLVDSIEI